MLSVGVNFPFSMVIYDPEVAVMLCVAASVCQQPMVKGLHEDIGSGIDAR